MEEFIKRLKQLLEQMNLTPYQLENTLGVSRGTFSKKILGVCQEFRVSTLIKLAEKYKNVDMNWLIRGDGMRNFCANSSVEMRDCTNLSSNISAISGEGNAKLIDIIAEQQKMMASMQKTIENLSKPRTHFGMAAEPEA